MERTEMPAWVAMAVCLLAFAGAFLVWRGSVFAAVSFFGEESSADEVLIALGLVYMALVLGLVLRRPAARVGTMVLVPVTGLLGGSAIWLGVQVVIFGCLMSNAARAWFALPARRR